MVSTLTVLLRGVWARQQLFLTITCILVGLALLGLTLPATVIDLHDVRLVHYHDFDEGAILRNFLGYFADSRTAIPGFVPVRTSGYGPLHGALGVLFTRPLRWFMPDGAVAVWFGLRVFGVLSGLAALLVLWHMVERHFGRRLAAVAVLSLMATPQFVGWFDHLKPESLTLLLIFLSLHFSLDLAQTYRLRDLLFATASAAGVFATKFFGFVLLPSIAVGAAVGLGREKVQEQLRQQVIRWQKWLIFFGWGGVAAALALAAVPFALILFYERKSTGMTWFATHGLIRPLAQPDFFAPRVLLPAATVLLLLSVLLLAGARGWGTTASHRRRWTTIYATVALQSVLSFAVASAILFYGWLVDFVPAMRYLLSLVHYYYTRGGDLSSNPTFDLRWFAVAVDRTAVGWLGMLFLGTYIVVELVCWRRSRQLEPQRQEKRIVLFLFIATYGFLLFAYVSRLTGLYLFPIVPLCFMLGFDALRLVTGARWRRWGSALLVVLFLADLFWRGNVALEWRLNRLQKPYDVGLTMGAWLQERYPVGTVILSDTEWDTYIPSSFAKVVYVHRYFADSLRSAGSTPTEFLAANSPMLVVLHQNSNDPDSMKLARAVQSAPYELVATFEGLHQARHSLRPHRFAVYQRAGLFSQK